LGVLVALNEPCGFEFSGAFKTEFDPADAAEEASDSEFCEVMDLA
jgi:hypothetical protein